MSIAEPLTVLKAELLQTVVPQLVEQLAAAAQQGQALHEVEQQLWDLLLQVGRRAVAAGRWR